MAFVSAKCSTSSSISTLSPLRELRIALIWVSFFLPFQTLVGRSMGKIPILRIGAVAGCVQLAMGAPLSGIGAVFDALFSHERQHSGAHASPAKRSPTSTDAATTIDGNCANTASTRQCWGGGYYIGTDSETSWPNTGVTRSYTLEITNITMAPDGTERQVFAVNGQYPGPTIEAGNYILW